MQTKLHYKMKHEQAMRDLEAMGNRLALMEQRNLGTLERAKKAEAETEELRLRLVESERFLGVWMRFYELVHKSLWWKTLARRWYHRAVDESQEKTPS